MSRRSRVDGASSNLLRHQFGRARERSQHGACGSLDGLFGRQERRGVQTRILIGTRSWWDVLFVVHGGVHVNGYILIVNAQEHHETWHFAAVEGEIVRAARTHWLRDD